MAYEPLFTITPKTLKFLEGIASYREKIMAATVQVSWIPTLQRDARVRNSHSSTAIEGNPLSLAEVSLLEEGKKLSTPTERSKQEILNYFAGLRFIEKHSKKKAVTHDDLFHLHSLLSKDVMDQGEPGKYRTIQVRVGNHVPPPPFMVSGLMYELLRWWNEKSGEWPAVITSGILHYRFEAIHPFADGNGRTGRMLALWELFRRGFDTHHIFSVDEVFWEKRPVYYQNLDLVRKNGEDLTTWLEYNSEAVHVTLERVWERVQRLKGEKSSEKIVLSPRQEKVLGLLRDHKSLSPKEIWEALGITRQGAIKLLDPLVKAGLIERIGSRKMGKYVLKG
jgi:Fic family protein